MMTLFSKWGTSTEDERNIEQTKNGMTSFWLPTASRYTQGRRRALPILYTLASQSQKLIRQRSPSSEGLSPRLKNKCQSP